jgi:predicted PhzF superfamily epimerase YddE/YHI9
LTAALHVLRVFCAEDDSGGNPLGVFLDGATVAPDERQGVARELGFSETVFVDDPVRGEIRIFTPAEELEFAGHPSVGTAWLLREERGGVAALRPPAGEVGVRYEEEETFIAGRPEWGPQFEFVEVGAPAEVDALEGAPEGEDLVGVWAWIDEAAGRVRERVFPNEAGIAEDEATGLAAIQLCARLGREIEIRQGEGSRLAARPLGDGRVEVGGRVVLEEVREHG